MGKNNNKIKLSEEEAIKAITDLDGIVIQSIQKVTSREKQRVRNMIKRLLTKK